MAQLVKNFVKTALRAPLSTSDTTLQLTVGTGAFFVIPAGDWCYVTINSATAAEVVKYTSTGSVVDDTITVVRAQDNTTAQAFPAGACVTEGWNVAQILGLINQQIALTPTPSNTMIVTAVPSGPPLPGIIYAITGSDVGAGFTPGLLWFWDADTLVWVQVAFNGVQIVNTPPTAAPDIGVIWAVNTTNNSLYYWTGTSWLLLSGANTSGTVEILAHQYLNFPTGTNLVVGDYPFAELNKPVAGCTGAGLTFDTVVDYKSNPSAVNVISFPLDCPGNANAYRFVLTVPCIIEVQASASGVATTPTDAVDLFLTLTHTTGIPAFFGSMINKPASTADDEIFINVASGPVVVPANDAWDANLIVRANPFTVTQMRISVTVISLSVS